MPKKGIMGGTFDPIHHGHLVAAEEVRDFFHLEEVVFVPSARPPHKLNQHISDPIHRHLMCVLATISNPHFIVSSVEIERKGQSYSIETIRYFKKQWGGKTEIFFIAGADAFSQISTWNNSSSLLEVCTFVVTTRPGFMFSSLSDQFRENVKTIEVSALAISSSEIRRRVSRKETIKYLLPEAVEDYIYKNGLYCEVR
ncbi:MAG TPA: nicotinate-nucleotide adenylyltransferase [Atribacteraceae bacterium]|nr:nicotinate-nucleotide adenylyltransferase [Atribacteraceae bacterium]